MASTGVCAMSRANVLYFLAQRLSFEKTPPIKLLARRALGPSQRLWVTRGLLRFVLKPLIHSDVRLRTTKVVWYITDQQVAKPLTDRPTIWIHFAGMSALSFFEDLSG